jgi:hypothetical protein
MTAVDYHGKPLAEGDYVHYKEAGFGNRYLSHGRVLKVHGKSISVQPVNPNNSWAPKGKVLAYKKPNGVYKISATEFKKLTKHYGK